MTRLRLLILGAGAGGGVPQWNCRCRVCTLAWANDGRVIPRTQSSIAVSLDGENWLLVNAAPEILEQIKGNPQLHPRAQPDGSRRHSPITSALLTNGDIDHVAGLLSLRESQPFHLYATEEIHGILRSNRVFDVLAEGVVERRAVTLDTPLEPLPGLQVRVFPVPGKTALYMETPDMEIGAVGQATVGVEFLSDHGSLYYIPGCAKMSEDLAARLQGAAAVLFDGTLWEDDEMITAGVGTKTGHRMGHLSISGPEGSMAAFKGLDVGRKVFVHINNTNPVLIEGSEERQAVEDAGWEVAYDGMEIRL
ncbi:MAG TPA: pyrroloquinoline quinone biosynthesis protein PqqB [Kiloniellales bacterium]|nr:pyrroloquinoline quinone biosynthesis protein PqqB [Kiloniellales bacterium]